MSWNGFGRVVEISVFLAGSLAFGQAVSLQEQLSAQYQFAKVSGGSGGHVVTTPGTLLTIQQKGVLGVPWKALALCRQSIRTMLFILPSDSVREC